MDNSYHRGGRCASALALGCAPRAPDIELSADEDVLRRIVRRAHDRGDLQHHHAELAHIPTGGRWKVTRAKRG